MVSRLTRRPPVEVYFTQLQRICKYKTDKDQCIYIYKEKERKWRPVCPNCSIKICPVWTNWVKVYNKAITKREENYEQKA